MANPLTSATISALLRVGTEDFSHSDVFVLATQGLINMTDDGFEHTSKATRALKRQARQAEAEEIRPIVWEAVKAVSNDPNLLFRLDDVLKASGLNKADHRDNILEALRHFRDGGLLETVKLSDNNFQIFWKRTPEGIDPSEVPEAPESEAPQAEMTEAPESEA